MCAKRLHKFTQHKLIHLSVFRCSSIVKRIKMSSKFSFSLAHGADQFLVELAEHVEKNDGKLLPKEKAETIAWALGISPEEVKGSYPWYIAKAKEFKALGVQLPLIGQAHLVRIGEPVEFCPLGVYRGVVDLSNKRQPKDLKPIVFDEVVVSYIYSKPELAALVGDARKLAKAINKERYGPTAERLRELLAEFNEAINDFKASQAGIRIEKINNENVPPCPPAFKAAPAGMTVTQLVELIERMDVQDGKIVEAIQNAVSFVLYMVLVLVVRA